MDETREEKIERILAQQREYRIQITHSDGTLEHRILYALREDGALKLFDDMFMSLHRCGKLLNAKTGTELTEDLSDVARLELLDYLSDAVLASYECYV